MSKSRKHIVVELFVLLCFILYRNVSGIQIDLTRIQRGDYFNNPYTSSCDDDDNEFCLATNSMCYTSYPHRNNKCCYCKCNAKETTFNMTSLRCATNEKYRQGGCSLRLGDGRHDESFLLDIDLTKSGQKKIVDLGLPSGRQYKLQSCAVNKVEQMSSNGYETVSDHTFGTGGIRGKDFDLTWPTASKDKDIHGKVYRITFNCQYRRPGQNNGEITDCLMFKSTGTVQIYHPGFPEGKSSSVLATSIAKTITTPSPSSPLLPSSPSSSSSPPSLSSSPSSPPSSPSPTTTQISSTKPVRTTFQWTIPTSSHLHEILPPSTAKEIIKPSSTFHFNSLSSTQWTTLMQSIVKGEVVEISTTKIASTTIDNRENPEETMAPVTSSIDTEFSTLLPKKEKRSSDNDGNTMVYIIVAVVVVVVVIIALAVVVRFTMIRNKKKMLKKRESKANIVMSDIKNDVDDDEDGLYTALDKSAGNDESNYQALTLPNVNKKQSIANAYNEKMRQNANDYIYADADSVYSTIDPQINDAQLGAKNNDAFDVNENERVYSILEQQRGQIDYATPSIQDDNEGVYCIILEEEPGKIVHHTPSIRDPAPADQRCTMDTAPIYVTVEDGQNMMTSCDYVTVLPPKLEPSKSDGSVYADLSDQRAGGNEYQSLVKRKK